MSECGFETSKVLMSTSQKEFLVLLVLQWSKSSTNVWRRQSNETLMANFENAPNGLPKFCLFDQCPEKSSLNVNHVFPVCPVCPVCRVCPVCPVWPVCGISLQSWLQYVPKITCLKSLNGQICKEVGGCTKGSWRLYTRKLLSDQMRIAESFAQIDNHQSGAFWWFG